MTGNVRDTRTCYPHTGLLPIHPHLASADFIRFLPVATRKSAHPLMTHSRSLRWHSRSQVRLQIRSQHTDI